ncbi:MAG: response regulator transcription factor [Planctomycetes bacterium]|nr:response regulator transcription factor [Planctomycetota bacterium]
MEKINVLVVEDEPEISALIRMHLSRSGFIPTVASSGKEAFSILEQGDIDLILLDLMLPDISGLDICKKVVDIPIIIVSALGDESDIVSGLELGAIDYVTKPFSPKILMARVRAVVRRTETLEADNTIKLLGGKIIIDNDRHSVLCNGNQIELTATEYGILCYFAKRPGFVRTRDQISQALHGDHAVLSNRTIDVHVTSLRKKLGNLSSAVETVRGVGYRLSEALDS